MSPQQKFCKAWAQQQPSATESGPKKITRPSIPSGAKGASPRTCTYAYLRCRKARKKKGDLCGEPCDEGGLCKTHKSTIKTKENKAKAQDGSVVKPAAAEQDRGKEKTEIKNLQTGKFVPKPAGQESGRRDTSQLQVAASQRIATDYSPDILRTPDGYLYRQDPSGDVIVYCTGEPDGMRAHLEDLDLKALQRKGWKVAAKAARDKAVLEGIFQVSRIDTESTQEAAIPEGAKHPVPRVASKILPSTTTSGDAAV